jgi:hypothetical protein
MRPVKASHASSNLIASNSKPFTDRQFIKECLIETVKFMCPDKVNYFQSITLTRNAVHEHTDGISNNLKIQLCNISKHFEAFSTAMDESRDVAQLAVFIRG